jgi:hypothetical protein
VQGTDPPSHHYSQEPAYRLRPVMSPSIRGGLMTGTHGRNDELKRGDLFSVPAKEEGLLPNPGRWSRGTCVSTTKEWLWPQAKGAQRHCSYAVDSGGQQRDVASILIRWLRQALSAHVTSPAASLTPVAEIPSPRHGSYQDLLVPRENWVGRVVLLLLQRHQRSTVPFLPALRWHPRRSI